MSLLRAICSLGLVGALMAAESYAAVIEIQPAKDNTLIQSTDPGAQRSNGQGDIFSGRTGQNPPTISVRRGLIQFDIAGSLPAGVIITSVTLTIPGVQGRSGDPTTTLHRVLQDWGEGASEFIGGQGDGAEDNDATWLYRFYNKANPTESLAWSTPGGDFVSAASGSSVISDDLGGGQLFSWSSAGMVDDVRFWLANPSQNFGWLILGDESMGQTAKRFNSGESAVPPVLAVEYVPEPSTVVLALAALGTIAAAGGNRNRRSRHRTTKAGCEIAGTDSAPRSD
ncbi:MAG: DNRLRE domain-containing protein [Planctomycetota bacterium]